MGCLVSIFGKRIRFDAKTEGSKEEAPEKLMHWILTPQESERYRERVAELAGSSDAVERIMAVLMNMHIGKFGMNEEPAREKAEVIFMMFCRDVS